MKDCLSYNGKLCTVSMYSGNFATKKNSDHPNIFFSVQSFAYIANKLVYWKIT